VQKRTVNIEEAFIFFALIFFLNPLLGILLIFNTLFLKVKLNKLFLVKLLSVFLSIFLAFINSTKIKENDLIFYIDNYLLSGDLSLMEYITFNGKEPAFFIFNYLFYHLTGGNVKLWIITFSFLSYMLFFVAIIKFFKINQINTSQLVLALILGAFFPQLFSLSAHLIRQFIAGSIFMYFAVNKIFYNKNKWWLIIIAVLTHSSSLLLFALVFFKFLGDFRNHRTLNFILILSLISYQYIAKGLLLFFDSEEGIIVYILKRASEDTTFNLGSFQLMNYLMMFIMIGIVFYHMYHLKKQSLKVHNSFTSKDDKAKKNNKKLNYFFSVMIFLSLFILVNINQSELSNRLFFYLFFYFPFVIPLLTDKIKQKSTVAYFVSILFLIFFAYRLEYGRWQYLPLYEIATNTFISFLPFNIVM